MTQSEQYLVIKHILKESARNLTFSKTFYIVKMIKYRKLEIVFFRSSQDNGRVHEPFYMSVRNKPIRKPILSRSVLICDGEMGPDSSGTWPFGYLYLKISSHKTQILSSNVETS